MRLVHHVTMIILAIFLIFATSTHEKSLPSFVKLCHKSDPEFNKCFKENLIDGFTKFAPGYKELGINKLEPLFVQLMDLGDANAGSVSLRQTYSNISIYGITKSTVIKTMDASFKGDDCYWNFESITPKVVMEADYNISGRVLVFPINGHGKCKITLENLGSKQGMKCERYMKNNKKHLRITEYFMEMKPEKVVYDFPNVVEGNEQISREINNTVNENALSVFEDVKDGFDKSYGLIYMNAGNQVFSRVPEEDLFLE